MTIHRNRKRTSKAYATEAQARAVAAQINAEHARRDDWLQEGALPCDEVLRAYLEVHRPTLARSTEETQEGSIECHLIPYFGSRDLRTIEPEDVTAFVVDRMEAGKSASLCINAVSLLRRVYSLHIEAGLLSRNPAKGAKKLVYTVAQRYESELGENAEAWTLEEAETLLSIAEETEPAFYAPLLAALNTGMRRGELLALQWDAIDFRRHRITVRRSRVRGREKGPKGSQEHRRPHYVPLSPALEALLRELAKRREAREGLYSDPTYVFPAPEAGHWDEHNFSRTWRRVRTRGARQGVRPLRFHCTRHTFATLAIEAGKSIKWVADALGHADPTVTLKTYAHVLDAAPESMDFVPGARRARNAPRRARKPSGMRRK